MNATLGRVTAELQQPIESAGADLVQLINDNINPPTPVNCDDVYIRALYIVSDEINSFGGCFPSDEHARLAELLVDSPVMVGHRKDRLPIGRNFHATTVTKANRSWVKSFFYWLKSAEGAENLRKNIDGGIYKECSIAFTYCLPECSVCGRDIRTCPHDPGRSGTDQSCHFNYRRIERVLETSLVYRGAIPNTRIAKALSAKPASSGVTGQESCKHEMSIHLDKDTDRAYMLFNQDNHLLCVQIYQFDCRRFTHGVRFLASMCELEPSLLEKIKNLPQGLSSKGARVRSANSKTIEIELDAPWASHLILRSLHPRKDKRFMVFCHGAGK